MSEHTKPEANPDDLTKTTDPGSIDLTEEELSRVSGGDGEYKAQKADGVLDAAVKAGTGK